jgi:hypothetical protein
LLFHLKAIFCLLDLSVRVWALKIQRRLTLEYPKVSFSRTREHRTLIGLECLYLSSAGNLTFSLTGSLRLNQRDRQTMEPQVCEHVYPLSDLVLGELSSLSWGRHRNPYFLDRWDRSGNRMRCKRCYLALRADGDWSADCLSSYRFLFHIIALPPVVFVSA